MEVIYWIQIFISPFLLSVIAGVIVYLNNPNNWWLSLLLVIIGAVLGTIFAERIRRKYGTTTYMGRIKGNAEFMNQDKSRDKEESK